MIKKLFGLVVYYDGCWWSWSGVYANWYLMPSIVDKPTGKVPCWTPFFGFVLWTFSKE